MQGGLFGTSRARRKDEIGPALAVPPRRDLSRPAVRVPATALGQSSLFDRPAIHRRDLDLAAWGAPASASTATRCPPRRRRLSADDFSRTYSPSITDTLMQRVPGVSTTDVQGNGFAQDLRYRGFAASPLQGTPQGLAVYMNGIRVNEAFGDTVNWDLIPTNAINRADIWTNNPVFGLNALGGAVNIQMKNGFTYSGTEVEAQGGSYGRVGGGAQYGREKDGVGVYLAAQGVNDDGWRYQSPARGRTLLWRRRLARRWRRNPCDRRRRPRTISAWSGRRRSSCSTRTGRRSTPGRRRRSNDMQLVALNGKFAAARHWTLQSNVYVRAFQQTHVDGNDADIERCSGAPAIRCSTRLCLR